jgi:nitroreductase
MKTPKDYPAPSVPPAELLGALQWRYAVKRFDPDRKIGPEVWSAIEESLVLTPSSFGLQPWRFIVVTDAELKAQLPAVSWGQQQPKDCSHLVVIATLRSMDSEYVDRFLQTVSETRKVPIDSLANYRKVILGFLQNSADRISEWATQQGYIALGQLMATAAYLGIDACPMEGIEPSKYDRFLGLEHGDYVTRVACAMGYRHSADGYASNVKVRFPMDVSIRRF